jgi:hypothetical protein
VPGHDAQQGTVLDLNPEFSPILRAIIARRDLSGCRPAGGDESWGSV